MEKTDGKFFVCSNGEEISGASKISDEFSRSGKFSVKVSKKNNYALHYKFAPIVLGDEVIVSIWKRKSKSGHGAVAVATGKSKKHYLSKGIKTEGDWMLIEKHFKINRELSDSLLDILVFNNNNEPAYFDDLKIKIIKNEGYSVVNHPALYQVSLSIKPKGINKLKEKRDNAIKTKVLISENDDWVNAKIKWNDDKENCELRLKGDWTDHLMGHKWSMRVKVSDDEKAEEFQQFSIQNPLSRGYLLEWLSHKILMDQNVLTTRFKFVNLIINNELKGIYSVEEHFKDELLLAQDREKGVIIKFDESPMWQFRSEHHKKNEGAPKWYRSTEIIPFGKKRTFTNNEFREDYLKGRDLLYRYQHGYGDLSQVFDIEQMAKFFALVDLFKSYHGLIWHNMRYYYNSESQKLEPIAYDLFTEYDPPKIPYPGFMAYNFLVNQNTGMYYQFENLFRNSDFLERYVHYLEVYSSEEFITDQLDKNEEDLEFYENEIKKEYRFYTFDSQFLFDNADSIRTKIDFVKSSLNEMINIEEIEHSSINPTNLSYKSVNNESVKVYSSIIENKAQIQFQSFYYKPIEITAYIVSGDTINLPEGIILPSNLTIGKPLTITIENSYLIDKVVYKIEGEPETYIQNVIPFRAPE